MFSVILLKKEKFLFDKNFTLSYENSDNFNFVTLKVKNTKRNNWRKIEKKLGNCRHRVILQKGLTIPANIDISEISGRKYSLRLLENGIKYLLEDIPCHLKKEVTLIDLYCRYQGLADILVDNFKMVRIVTIKTEKYNAYVQEKRVSQGASIVVFETLSASFETSFYLSPDGIILKEMENSIAPIITSKIINADVKAQIISDFNVEVPEYYKKIIPPNIDEHLFLSALYEYCGVSKLAILRPSKAKLENEAINMDKLKMKLFAIDIK